LPALWTGIYYDQEALDAAWDLVKDWTTEDRQAMRSAVPTMAFSAPFRDGSVRDLARRMLEISAGGLRRRAAEDSIGSTEEGFLQPLVELVERGYTRAEELLRSYETEWNRDLAPLFTEYNFL
jgi:glutamate--cysteine ligase